MSANRQPSRDYRHRAPTIVGGKVNPKAKPTRPPIPLEEEGAEDGVADELDGELLSAPSTGGPRSSFFGSALMKVGGRLFRLGVKLIPAGGALVGATYGYTYFFGSIPILESLKEQLGMEVTQTEPQQSRVNQMLQQTRNAVAANDTRVALSTAIIDGDAATADAIQDGKLVATADGLVSTDAKPTTDTDAASLFKDAMDVLDSAGRDTISAADKLVASASNPNRPNITVETSVSPYQDYPQTVTVVQDSHRSHSRFRNIDFQSGPPASPEFNAWIQALRVQGVTRDFRPKITLFSQTFPAGEIVDFALGVTFEGFADNGTILVFKERSGAYLATKI